MGASFNRILDRFVWNGLWIAGIAGAVLFGGTQWPTKTILVALSCAVFLAYVLLMFRKGFRIRYDGVTLVGLLLAGVMLFQLLPLPAAFLSWLSPVASKGVEAARELGFDVPARVSMNLSETVDLLTLAGAALALYLVAFNIAHRDGSGEKVLAIVGAAAAVVSLITVAQAATGAPAHLWVFVPSSGMPENRLFFSSFVNNNNAAALLNLGLFSMIGIRRKAQFGRTKGLLGVLVLLIGAASTMMLSRGGLLALGAGLVLLALMSRWAGIQKRTPPSVIVTLLGGLLIVAIAVLFMVVFDAVLQRTEGVRLLPQASEESKVAVWWAAKPMVKAFGLAGAGAGGFGTAFTQFNDFLGTAYVSHAENEVIQLFVDFGIPVAAVVILLSLGLIWRRFVVERGSSYYAEAICGLAAVALGNLADFSIRIPGVLLPTALAAGAVGGQFARTWSKTSGWRMTLASVKVLPVAATAFLLVIVGSGFARESNQDSALALARALPAVPAEVGSDVADATSLRLVALHPHDAYLYTFLGNNRLHAGDLETARRLYLHALELHPLCIPPKVGLARYYLKTGNPAAMLDETLELLVELPKHRVPLFAAVDEAGIAESLIVESWQAEEDVLQDYAKYLGYVRKPAKQERFLKAAIAKIGWDLDLLDRLGSLYLSQLRLEDADLTATYIMALFPERQEGFLLQARVFMYGTRTEEALVMYDEALSKPGPGTVEIGLEMLNVLARTRNWDRFEALAVELRVQVRKDRQQTARFHVIMALREEMFNRDYLALWQLDQAEASDPYDTSVIIKKAEVQRRLGRVDKAAAEYRKALKIDPKHTGAMEGLRSLETGESPPTT